MQGSSLEGIVAALDGHVPGRVRQHWVDVGGVRWPVKQAWSLVSGTSADTFNSHTARRRLQELGLDVGGQITGRPTRASRSDPITLPVIEDVVLRLSFQWRSAGDIELDDAEIPTFPRLPQSPGLYRLTFVEPGGLHSRYIGESSSLVRRASNYRNARNDNTTQRTSRRVHRLIVDHLRHEGARIAVAICVAVQLDDGIDLDLRLKSSRRLAENGAVVLAQLSGERIHNIDTDVA